MNHISHPLGRSPRGFTLVELMVSIAIVAILASLTLAGLSVARQRVKRDRTELTIRKIHEVIMPHYERFRTRPRQGEGVGFDGPEGGNVPASLTQARDQIRKLVTKRRSMVFELPDGWADLIDTGTAAGNFFSELNPNPPYSAIARRLRLMVINLEPEKKMRYRTGPYSDAECLWATVMRAGFADPAIVENFREDEFGDKDRNGAREFIDGWGNPIRFLRWAPAFESRYQPAGAAMSHDAFDPGGRDPVAMTTLFPLIFSCGPDGEPAIACRNAEGDFSYPKVAFDPYFATSERRNLSPGWHLTIRNSAGNPLFRLGRYDASYDSSTGYTEPFGTRIDSRPLDDVSNHAMSR